MGMYRKKPVEIEAIIWKGDNLEEIMAMSKSREAWCGNKDEMFIKTLEGTMKAKLGDYIIKGVKGEIYPCKPDIFILTYEAI